MKMNKRNSSDNFRLRANAGCIPLLLLLLLPLSGLHSLVQARDVVSLEDKTKAAFIYHFTKYIQWPKGDSSRTFNIGVLGTSKIIGPLAEISNLKKIENRRIVIQQLDSIQQCKPCHILFIADPEDIDFDRIIARLKDANTLIITDTKGYGKKGSCINFIARKGKLHFEINRTSLENMHLTASSQLLKLAIIINGEESDD